MDYCTKRTRFLPRLKPWVSALYCYDLNEELADLEETIDQAEERKRSVRESVRSLKHDRAERVYREQFANEVSGLAPVDAVESQP